MYLLSIEFRRCSYKVFVQKFTYSKYYVVYTYFLLDDITWLCTQREGEPEAKRRGMCHFHSIVQYMYAIHIYTFSTIIYLLHRRLVLSSVVARRHYCSTYITNPPSKYTHTHIYIYMRSTEVS